MAKFLAHDIHYDTDGEAVELPDSVEITAKNLAEAKEIGADQISNQTGFLVENFRIKKA